MIYLITDFGIDGPYLGQVLSVLARRAPQVPVINLISDAPAFDPIHAAYLVAAYSYGISPGDVVLGVIDPGVGGDRAGIVLNADGIWYVGPDNGLFEVASGHADKPRWWILPEPHFLSSVTFHGRDWFAPYAADLATGLWHPASTSRVVPPSGGHDLSLECAEIIYVDHYGNAMTGLSGTDLTSTLTLHVDDYYRISWAGNFSVVKPGHAFWYVNANGLVELAANRARVCDVLDIGIGTPVKFII